MLKPSVALRCVGKGQKYHINKTRILMRKTCINTIYLETKIGQYICDSHYLTFCFDFLFHWWPKIARNSWSTQKHKDNLCKTLKDHCALQSFASKCMFVYAVYTFKCMYIGLGNFNPFYRKFFQIYTQQRTDSIKICWLTIFLPPLVILRTKDTCIVLFKRIKLRRSE